MNAFIRLLYAVLIAGAVATFIGVGAASVYQAPQFPEHTFKPYNPNASAEEMNKEQADNDKAWKDHQKAEKAYYKKVTTLVLPASLIVLAFGLYYMKRSEIIGEGLALGGIATSLYGVVTASLANQSLLRFLSVSVLLAGALLLTHKRFLEPAKTKKK